MIKHLIVLLAFLMTIGSQASAFDPVDLQKLKDTGEYAECDLKNANLDGSSLLFASMQGAILCNTTMQDGSVIYSGC